MQPATIPPDPTDPDLLDLNMVVLNGRLASSPELRRFESGSRLLRLLVTVRATHPRRRVDVLPVTLWDPDVDHETWQPGDRIWVSGTLRRRFYDGPAGRTSRLEVVAGEATRRPPLDAT